MDNFEKAMLALYSFAAGVYATQTMHGLIQEKATDTAVCLIFTFVWLIGAYYWSRQ